MYILKCVPKNNRTGTTYYYGMIDDKISWYWAGFPDEINVFKFQTKAEAQFALPHAIKYDLQPQAYDHFVEEYPCPT